MIQLYIIHSAVLGDEGGGYRIQEGGGGVACYEVLYQQCITAPVSLEYTVYSTSIYLSMHYTAVYLSQYLTSIYLSIYLN